MVVIRPHRESDISAFDPIGAVFINRRFRSIGRAKGALSFAEIGLPSCRPWWGWSCALGGMGTGTSDVVGVCSWFGEFEGSLPCRVPRQRAAPGQRSSVLSMVALGVLAPVTIIR